MVVALQALEGLRPFTSWIQVTLGLAMGVYCLALITFPLPGRWQRTVLIVTSGVASVLIMGHVLVVNLAPLPALVTLIFVGVLTMTTLSFRPKAREFEDPRNRRVTDV